MIISRILLSHFRSYTTADFSFSPETTVIVGPNTAGKSNLIEALVLLSIGKSFRAEKDIQMISFGEEIARVKGKVITDQEESQLLEVMIAQGVAAGGRSFMKRFLINDIPKRRIDFTGQLKTVLFTPLDLELISDGPSLRRNFLDDVLEQCDYDYRVAKSSYTRALKQRNALLEQVKETGLRDTKHFEYWDDLLISSGTILTDKRDAFISYINEAPKQLFDFRIHYDKSSISEERLAQYSSAEVGAGVTLVGPHRDDFVVYLGPGENDVRYFGSRGQQRLVVLQLKLLQLSFMEQTLHGQRPLLLLDDIFSELDSEHIHQIFEHILKQQTIITTTHKEFFAQEQFSSLDVIELKQA